MATQPSIPQVQRRARRIAIGSLLAGLLLLLTGIGQAQTLANPAPPNSGVVTVLRPEIGATFLAPVQTGTVHLYLDGQEVTGYSTVTSGAVRYAPGSDLAPGVHRARVLASGATGGSVDLSWSFTVATALLNVAPAAGSTVKQSRPEVGATFLTPVNTATVKLYLDGKEVTGYSTVSNSQIRFNPSIDLTQGSHKAQVLATSTGGKALDQSWSFVVASRPVQGAPADGTTYKGRRPEVGATFTQPVDPSSLHLYLDGQEVTLWSSRSTSQVRHDPSYDLKLGSHTARVTGKLKSGEVVDYTWNFTVEAASSSSGGSSGGDASAYLRSAPANGASLASRRPEVGATFLAPVQTSTVHLYLDGHEVTGYSTVTSGAVRYQPNADLASGSHQARLTAVMAAGQSVDTSWNFSLTGTSSGGSTGGQVFKVTPAQGTEAVTQRPEIGATFLEPVKPATLKLLLNGVDVTSMCRISNSQIRFLPGYDLGSGLHRATLSGFTAAGREFATNWTFTIR